MDNLKKIKEAKEKLFARDEEIKFKAAVRCCKLFGNWIGSELGLSEEETKKLVKKIISVNVNMPDLKGIKSTVRPYIEESDKHFSDHVLDRYIERFYEQAKDQIFEEEAQ